MLHAIYPLLLLVAGAALAIPGVRLAVLGGSWWYGLGGLAMIGSAVLLYRRSRYGVWLYGGMLIATIVWAIWEVGWTPWGLLPRLLVPVLLGVGLLMPRVQRGLTPQPRKLEPWIGWLGLGGATVSAAILVFTLQDREAPANNAPQAVAAIADSEWRHYGATLQGQRYSALTQITPANVANLVPVWTARTGLKTEFRPKAGDEATPIKVGDLLYTCTGAGDVLAIDAITGRIVWRTESTANLAATKSLVCRGVSHARVAASGDCADRILVGTPDPALKAYDARTGRACAGFGRNGVVDLTEGLGRIPAGTYTLTSPGVVIDGKIVVGSAIADNYATDMPSGVVRAFDVLTGALSWAWDMGDPGNSAGPPPGKTYTRSTPNVWTVMSADEALGLVYLPLGNPSPDHLGADRRPFDERFGSSLVALDATTGALRWSFQTVHHDIWDYDLPAQPTLVDISTPGGTRPALILPTKQGDIFVLDRTSGRPIFPVTEVPVPGGAIPGERAAATQPRSALSLVEPPIGERDMWGISPFDQLWCRIAFRKAHFQGHFTPPALRATINNPGFFGIMNWGGVSVDPDRQLMFVNSNAMSFLVQLVPPSGNGPGSTKSHVEAVAPTAGAKYGVAFKPFLSPLGVPCQRPPWGKLRAFDLRNGSLRWSRIVGTARDSGPFGLRSGLALPLGTPQIGGTIVTRGGLVFSAATADDYLRAYDVTTGRELWRGRLPAGGQATPMTYAVNGRQFVVVTAGGHPPLGTRRGDHLVAFALP